ncbi:MAG: hypothetical protein IPI29_08630 [Ignavibacteria bacterium]|nr:hypothetical protein [Ignavibacteria bacterium]
MRSTKGQVRRPVRTPDPVLTMSWFTVPAVAGNEVSTQWLLTWHHRRLKRDPIQVCSSASVVEEELPTLKRTGLSTGYAGAQGRKDAPEPRS